jgi:hypothetical protein
MAAGSTSACLTNTTTETQPARFVDTQDKWVRAQVYDGKVSGRAAHCVSTPQTSCTDGASGGNPGSVWIKSDGSRIVAGPGSQVSNVSSRPQAYGLVYIDKNGTYNTLDPNGDTSLSWASIACYSSVLASPISTLG